MSAQPLPALPKPASSEPENPTLAGPRFVAFGDFHVDLQQEELFKDGTRVKLQGKVYQALLALLQRPGELVSREELRLRLWSNGTYVNFDANVNTTVNKLRQALSDSTESPVYVETIPRRGYSFIARVRYSEQLEKHRPAKSQQPAPMAPVEKMPENFTLLRNLFFSRWFTAGVVTVIIASMLFGAAIALFAYR